MPRVLHTQVNLGCGGGVLVMLNLVNAFPGSGIATLSGSLEECFFPCDKQIPYHQLVPDGSNLLDIMENYDILHVHWNYSWLLRYPWKELISRFPVVVTIHSTIVPFNHPGAYLVAVGEVVQAMQHYSCQTIYNGFDLGPFLHDRTYEDKPKLKVGFVCRMDGKTTPNAVTQMRKAVSKMSHPVELVLVGAGDQNLLNAYEGQGVGCELTMLGWRSDIGECLKEFDLFLYPTWTDALPTVVVEAMASGLPVIAPPVGGLVELLGKGRGLLTSLDYGIEDYMPMFDDPQVRARIGRKAQDYAQKHFQLDRMVREYDDLYTESLGNHSVL